MDSSTVICWTSPFVIFGMSGLCFPLNSNFDGKSSKKTLYVASDLGLHCLPLGFQVTMGYWMVFMTVAFIIYQ